MNIELADALLDTQKLAYHIKNNIQSINQTNLTTNTIHKLELITEQVNQLIHLHNQTINYYVTKGDLK